MIETKNLIYLGLLLVFSGCRSYHDFAYNYGDSMTIWAHKNSTLLKANELYNDSVKSIVLMYQGSDSVNFDLLNKNLRSKVKTLWYHNESRQQVNRVLSKFPGIEVLEVLKFKKSRKVVFDPVLAKYNKLRAVSIQADSIEIQDLPSSLTSLSISSNYMHFPYIPGHVYDYLIVAVENNRFDYSGFKFDYRNFKNVRNGGYVGVGCPRIVLDSIYVNLRADTLKFMYLFGENLVCEKRWPVTPHIKSLNIVVSALEKIKCDQCFDADSVYLRITEDNKPHSKEEYYSYFKKKPLYINIYISPAAGSTGSSKRSNKTKKH